MSDHRGPAPLPLWRRPQAIAQAESWRLGGLPWPLGRVLGRLSGRTALRGRRRRRALRHLAMAFPEWSPGRLAEVAREAAAHAGEAWMTWARLPRLEPEERMARFDVSALEDPVRSGLEARTGAIVVTGCVGHWEGLAASLAAATGDVMLVVHRSGPASWREACDLLRRRCLVRSCSFASARIDAARWLKLNRVLVVVADGDAGREGAFLPLFGHAASHSPLAVQLAAGSGAPCLAAFCVRGGDGRYRSVAADLEVPRRSSREAQERALSRWVDLLEGALRGHPGQARWPLRRWRTRPPRGASAELIVVPDTSQEGAP